MFKFLRKQQIMYVDKLLDDVDPTKTYCFNYAQNLGAAKLLQKYVSIVFMIHAEIDGMEQILRHELKTDAEHEAYQRKLAAHLKILGDTLAIVCKDLQRSTF